MNEQGGNIKIEPLTLSDAETERLVSVALRVRAHVDTAGAQLGAQIMYSSDESLAASWDAERPHGTVARYDAYEAARRRSTAALLNAGVLLWELRRDTTHEQYCRLMEMIDLGVYRSVNYICLYLAVRDGGIEVWRGKDRPVIAAVEGAA